jgi:glucokinase
MALLGIDLGGTKLAIAVFSNDGELLHKETVALGKRSGSDVGQLITEQAVKFIQQGKNGGDNINSIGISVPGIAHPGTGTAWVPNIPGWEDYPLLEEVREVCGDIPVTIDSDRACYILGELWRGNARGCRDAIFLSVGTGIGAGILINGEILRGSHDIAGCIGWMALQRPYDDKYKNCGCFEYYASGEGIAKVANSDLIDNEEYDGILRRTATNNITSHDVFLAYKEGDLISVSVIKQCVEFWGMAVANLVSLFNPEKIIFGGGVFGPALPLLPEIYEEARKWAQPVGIKQVTLTGSGLQGDAGVYGAGFLALKSIYNTKSAK